MTCPNCGAQCESGHLFCSRCGSTLKQEKRGSHLPPILIMAGLSLVGIILFFLFPA